MHYLHHLVSRHYLLAVPIMWDSAWSLLLSSLSAPIGLPVCLSLAFGLPDWQVVTVSCHGFCHFAPMPWKPAVDLLGLGCGECIPWVVFVPLGIASHCRAFVGTPSHAFCNMGTIWILLTTSVVTGVEGSITTQAASCLSCAPATLGILASLWEPLPCFFCMLCGHPLTCMGFCCPVPGFAGVLSASY